MKIKSTVAFFAISTALCLFVSYLASAQIDARTVIDENFLKANSYVDDSSLDIRVIDSDNGGENWAGLNYPRALFFGDRKSSTGMTYLFSQRQVNDIGLVANGKLGLIVNNEGKVGIGTYNAKATLDIAGGADADGVPGPYSIASIAFQLNKGGGYRHWIKSRHAADPNRPFDNAIEFYLNSSASADGSSAPGVGSVLGMSVTPKGVGIGTAAQYNTLQLQNSLYAQGVGIGFSSNGGSTPTQARIRVADNNWSGHMLFETTVPGSDTGPLIERMRIQNDGKVGIGVSTPTSSLDVNGALTLRNGNNNVGYSAGQIFFGWNGEATYQHSIRSRHNANARTGNAMDFCLWKQGTDAAGSANSSQQVMTLDGSGTGSVGIGTTAPLAKLHLVTEGTRTSAGSAISVNGSTTYNLQSMPYLQTSLRLTNTQGSTSSAYDAGFGINLWDTNNNKEYKTPFLNIETDQDDMPIVMEINNKAKMQITQTQVLIGSNLPGLTSGSVITYPSEHSTLIVDGRILSTGLTCKDKSQLRWPDYVFEDSYALKPLEEVSEYIAEHRHLPDVPSNKEVFEKGIDVSEMFKIQMQKIEELTLYTIEQQKQLKQQQKQFKEQQQQQIKEQQQQINTLTEQLGKAAR